MSTSSQAATEHAHNPGLAPVGRRAGAGDAGIRSRASRSRARCSALLTAGTVVSSSSATSLRRPAERVPQDEHRALPAGSSWIAATNASPSSSRRSPRPRGPASSSSSRSGSGWSGGRAGRLRPPARASQGRRSSRSGAATRQSGRGSNAAVPARRAAASPGARPRRRGASRASGSSAGAARGECGDVSSTNACSSRPWAAGGAGQASCTGVGGAPSSVQGGALGAPGSPPSANVLCRCAGEDPPELGRAPQAPARRAAARSSPRRRGASRTAVQRDIDLLLIGSWCPSSWLWYGGRLQPGGSLYACMPHAVTPSVPRARRAAPQ